MPSSSPTPNLDTLFQPGKLGGLKIQNRVVLPALTRQRCNPDRTVSQDMIEYYEARSTAGLIITEPCHVSKTGAGYVASPALHAPEHVAGWRKVTDSLHSKGCTVMCQLWHTGRMSHSSFQPSGASIIAPSAIRVGDETSDSAVKPCGVQAADGTWAEHEMPRALTTAEVAAIAKDFGRAAKLALEAGFDGVEIHAGGGYLIDTFLQSSTNTRTDKYGGDAAKRSAFLLEVVEHVASALGSAAKVGVRLTPNSGFNGMGALDNHDTFVSIAKALDATGIAYIHVQDGLGTSGAMPSFYGKITSDGFHKAGVPLTLADLRAVFSRGLIGNGEYTPARAANSILEDLCDAVSFGRPFLGNPDLVTKLKASLPLDPPPAEEAWFGPSTREGVAKSWGYTELPSCGPRTRTKVLHQSSSPVSDYYEQLSTKQLYELPSEIEPPSSPIEHSAVEPLDSMVKKQKIVTKVA